MATVRGSTIEGRSGCVIAQGLGSGPWRSDQLRGSLSARWGTEGGRGKGKRRGLGGLGLGLEELDGWGLGEAGTGGM